MTVEEAKAGIGRRIKYVTDGRAYFHGTLINCPPGMLPRDAHWFRTSEGSELYSESPEPLHFDDVAPVAPAPPRDFPHACPRCGGAAYVGFRAVEHQHGGEDCHDV